jgi:AcrR family transcriptional regulator
MVEASTRLGYAEVSVQRVVESSGVARSTFYEHFADREECFLAALGQLGERLLDSVNGAIAKGGPAASVAVEAMVDFAEANPTGARVVFVQSLAGGPPSLALRRELLTKITAVVEQTWARAPGDAAAMDLPAEIAIGGVFRLLAMRLRRTEVGLAGLANELSEWIEAYAITAGPARQRKSHRLGRAEPSGMKSMPVLDAPSALSRGRHRLSAAEVARSQRLRILRATARCSSEHGYATVTVADITAAAQVSRKAFYAQFHDKAEAATEANESVFQGAMSACAAAFFAAPPEWPERVWAGGAALLDFLAAYPQDSYLGFVEAHAIGAAAVQHVYDRLGAFTLFLEEGYRFRPTAEALPKTCSEVLAATMFELAFRELSERRNLGEMPQLLPELAYTILAPFMGTEVARDFVERKAAGD